MNDTTASANNKGIKFMGRLTTKQRNALPSKDFADPKNRKYPMEDKGHAQAAMGRAAEFAGPKLKAKVKAKAKKRFPGISTPKPDKIAKEYVK